MYHSIIACDKGLPCVRMQCCFLGQLILDKERETEFISLQERIVFSTLFWSLKLFALLNSRVIINANNFLYFDNVVYCHTATTAEPHDRNMASLYAKWSMLIFLFCLPWSCTEKSIRFQYCCRAIIFSRALSSTILSLKHLPHFDYILTVDVYY